MPLRSPRKYLLLPPPLPETRNIASMLILTNSFLRKAA